MIKYIITFLAALSLTACDGETTPVGDKGSSVSGWTIIEEAAGKKVGWGVSLVPADSLWAVTIEPGDELDAVFKRAGILESTQSITVRYTVEGDSLYPAEAFEADPIMTIIVQQRGDDWMAKGDKANYRWYSVAPMSLAPGEHEATFSLDEGGWVNVHGQRPAGRFPLTLRNAESIGLTFGHWGGRMHGVASKANVTFTLTAFGVTQ